MFAHPETTINLRTPLKRRGRPKSCYTARPSRRRLQQAYGHSPLSLLHQENKITTEQYNAGETFLWILRQIRKNLPVPGIAQNRYQEKVKSIFYEYEVTDEGHLKEIFKMWYHSIYTLKKMGSLTKNLLEDFVWHQERSIKSLSAVELQLIKRGLDCLATIYMKENEH